MISLPPPSFCRHSGQALTEFLVVALALLPLFLLVPLIAKYQDISHATQLASRYAAFDAMMRNGAVGTWKPEVQLADEVRSRFFSNTDGPIRTATGAGDFDTDRPPFWADPAGDALVQRSADIRITYGPGGGADHSSGFEAAHDMATFVLANGLRLESRGVYSANVTVNVADLPAGLRFYEPFDQLGLAMTRSTSLLLDPWTARDPQQVEQRISTSPAVFPAARLASASTTAGALVTVVEAPGAIPPPQLGRLEFWRDVVPKDRLRSRN